MSASRTPAPGPALPWLVADIGGTNARFGWVAKAGAAVTQVRTLRAADHPGAAAAARAYLDELARELGADWVAPRAGAFAVATAVSGDRVEFTNSGWSFSRLAVAAELGLDALLVLNDFEALALSLPTLAAGQLRVIGEAASAAPPRAARAVIGPGTGLGVAGLLPRGDGWLAIPGEGGHATLAAGDEFEAAVIAAVRREFAHVSAERLLSGIGLPVLHRGVAAALGVPAGVASAEAIVEGALADNDALAARTVEVFCSLLGGFAGNVALTLGARAGVYIGGGIVPRLGDRFFRSRFRERFEAKGRFEGYLRAIPTFLITDTLAALGGTAAALGQVRN